MSEKTFRYSLLSMGFVLVLVCLFIFVFLLDLSFPLIQSVESKSVLSFDWNPPLKSYGVYSFILGTALSSLVALLIAGPVAVMIALCLDQVFPKLIARWVSFLVEMLAAVPSVVYGLWGLTFLVPFLRESFMPSLQEHFPIGLLFGGPLYGVSIFSAGVILSIMILPTMVAVIRESFSQVPSVLKEGVLALGATRTEMMSIALLQTTKTNVFSSFFLGLGRAIGETMAVTMVIGNSTNLPESLFSPGQTLASVIASEVAEAHGVHLAALGASGLVLFLFSSLIFFGVRKGVLSK